jgi:hypothetical protein
MKRKLVLIFEDNKLLHATLTERGRRVKLPKITTNDDALTKVKDTLTDALSIVGAAPSTSTTPNSTFANSAGASNQCVYDPATGLLHATQQVPAETTPIAFVQEQPRPRSVCARPKKDEKESLTIAPCN